MHPSEPKATTSGLKWLQMPALEARLIKWMIGIAVTATGVVAAAGTAVVVAVFRALG